MTGGGECTRRHGAITNYELRVPDTDPNTDTRTDTEQLRITNYELRVLDTDENPQPRRPVDPQPRYIRFSSDSGSWGVAPGWYGAAPLALDGGGECTRTHGAITNYEL